MFEKINVIEICKRHLNTLYDANSNEKKTDYGIFFGIPYIFAVLFLLLNPIITGTLQTIISTVFAIFTALLLSLLLLLFTMSEKIPENMDEDRKIKVLDVLKQTIYSISFLILISIISLIVILFLAIITASYDTKYVVIIQLMNIVNISLCVEIITRIFIFLQILFSFISYYLLGIFLLTLLMVLKRVSILLWTILGLENSDKSK